jgi:hypothetical protein
MKGAVLILFIAVSAVAQTNLLTSNGMTNPPANEFQTATLRAEKIRADCIQGRRIICGKILRVLPEGLVVESGYTNLLRPALSSSWLVPGRVVAARPANLLESSMPGSPCVGVVFLTDLPKIRKLGAKPNPYDYVVLLGYQAGQSTYTSVGSIQKTVRRFSANLAQAVRLNFAAGEKTATTRTVK